MTAEATEDVDEIAVERACRGDRSVPLNRAEMAAAMELCERRGLSASQIAELLGVTQRTVVRVRTGATDLPYTRPGASVDTSKEKIGAALKSESITVRRAAMRANDALAHLDTVLADWDAKQMARERIAELEAALAEAKAALRPTKPAKKKTTTARPTGEHAQARAWAQENGIAVPDRGLVSKDVIDRWRQSSAAGAA